MPLTLEQAQALGQLSLAHALYLGDPDNGELEQRWEMIASVTGKDTCEGCGATPSDEDADERWWWQGDEWVHRCSPEMPACRAVAPEALQEPERECA